MQEPKNPFEFLCGVIDGLCKSEEIITAPEPAYITADDFAKKICDIVCEDGSCLTKIKEHLVANKDVIRDKFNIIIED